MFELFLYSNVFIRYGHLFMSVQKQQLFQHFKTINGSFTVVSHSIFEETCILLESSFHAEWNGFCPSSIYQSICKL